MFPWWLLQGKAGAAMADGALEELGSDVTYSCLLIWGCGEVLQVGGINWEAVRSFIIWISPFISINKVRNKLVLLTLVSSIPVVGLPLENILLLQFVS